MKPRLLFIASLVLALSLWLVQRENRSHAPSPQDVSANTATTGKPALTQAPDAAPSPSPTLLSDEEKAENHRAMLDQIHDASVTYDPQQLPVIAEFLLHAHPEIREAALNGMIVLGDSAAAPLLRDAAKLAPTPKEAVALEEAAAYLELPSARDVKRRKK
jgi:hypothetical protein